MNKTVVCVQFSKTAVFCALAQISGRKVDIIAIDHIQIENGILEEGVIYDVPHLEQIVKNLVTSVSKGQNKIDCAWIAIPDNKVLITKFEVNKDRKGIDENELHKVIEEKFNYSASKLHLINRPTHELNKKVFFLSHAIRVENLSPFVRLFDNLNIPVDSVFPTFQCLFENLKDKFNFPTLLLYPSEKGFKFFLADSDGVHLESVWGHNVIEFNENFDKAINEIVQYSKNSKEVALGVKNILVLESSKFDSDSVQKYLQRTGIPFNWISNEGDEENGFDPVNIRILKGMVKSAMAEDFSEGFLGSQLTSDLDSFIPNDHIASASILDLPNPHTFNTPQTAVGTKSTLIKTASDIESKWNLKIVLSSILIGLGLLSLLAYMGIKLSDRYSKTKGEKNPTVLVSPTPTLHTPITPSPILSPSPTQTPTPSPSPTPVIEYFTKDQVKVLVLNGNSTAGQASVVSSILNNTGFETLPPSNASSFDIPTTTVAYKDPKSKLLAEEVAKLIEPSYPSAKAALDNSIGEDILVTLGAK